MTDEFDKFDDSQFVPGSFATSAVRAMAGNALTGGHASGLEIGGRLAAIRHALQTLGLVCLPIWGFKDPNAHVLCATPNLWNLVKMQRAATSGNFDPMEDVDVNLKVFAAGKGINLFARHLGMLNNSDGSKSMIGALAELYSQARLPGLVFPRANYLSSYQFFGVQSQGFRGITYYRDKKLDSYAGSQMHYPLRPSEYLMYGLTVRAATEGEVVEVVNSMDDKLRKNLPIKFGSIKVEEHLGNMIRIRKGIVEFTYGGLMRGSIRHKVGDKVGKGDPIGRVGCSCFSDVPMLYFQIGTQDIHEKRAITGNIGAPLPNRTIFGYSGIKWDTYYRCDLLNLKRFSGVTDNGQTHEMLFRNLDPSKIKYELSALPVSDACLVKKLPKIYSE
jgi:murein DD-endopeptidase MepM/ murein hydrolase activator NlpD